MFVKVKMFANIFVNYFSDVYEHKNGAFPVIRKSLPLRTIARGVIPAVLVLRGCYRIQTYNAGPRRCPPAGPRWALGPALAPAPSWASLRGPGREDRRLRQRPGPWVKVFRSIMVGIVTASGSGEPGQGERIGSSCPPSSRTTVGPAASRPWPGPWVLRLAPAMPWSLSGAPGRKDQRHRQRPGPGSGRTAPS